MPNTFATTKDDWKRLADIDYFGMYVKAYIPFNAWMNINYATEKTDRDKISAIRSGTNPFKNKIVSLIEDDDQDGEDFRTWIGSLHGALEQARIYNKGNYISFVDIGFKNDYDHYECKIRSVLYRVWRVVGSDGAVKVHVVIESTINDQIKVDEEFQGYKNDIREITNQLNGKIPEKYMNGVIDCYKRIAPYVHKSLLASRPRSKKVFKCGRFKFEQKSDDLAQGLISIFYRLRNSLFHGEVNPNNESQKVYGAAYNLLRKVIDVL